ncbi:MAG: toll/interleukin-1 receptor domain-containing protein [Lachnospiraceae bacterium]|nr:toll/interleukin-1 receptor domain-containing protein [Lachnospiraceae bacterium]
MIFISYAWKGIPSGMGNGPVLRLAAKLKELGYDANLDILEMQKAPSLSFSRMMAENLQKAEKVIILLSEEYKKKAEAFQGGVGTEYEFILSDMRDNESKYILGSFEPPEKEVRERIVPGFWKGKMVYHIPENMLIEDTDFMYAVSGRERYKLPEVSKLKYLPEQMIVTGSRITEEKTYESEHAIRKTGTVFFDNRMRSAFPGVRGLRDIDNPEKAAEGLRTVFEYLNNGVISAGALDEVWRFMGTSSAQIERFRMETKTKCILDDEELEIRRVVPFIHPGRKYYRDFLYVETAAEKPIGLYEHDEKAIEDFRNEMGYYSEEYGLYAGTPVTRAEYDDGGACIDGKFVRFETGGCELRCRYLTPYNFIICAKFSPFNCIEADKNMGRLLDDILVGKGTVEDIVAFGASLSRHAKDY